MSEQQPLLLSYENEGNDVEQADGGAEGEKGHIARWREHTAVVLESRLWHYTVIALARISWFYRLFGTNT